MLVKLKNTHFVSVLFFVSYFLVAEIGENAPDARQGEHVSPNCTSVREARARAGATTQMGYYKQSDHIQ